MGKRNPEQSLTPRIANNVQFVRLLKNYLFERGWSQKDLADACEMTESMVCRMINNDNGHGDSFDLTPYMVMKIACGLTIGWSGYRKLMEAAYPEFIETLDEHQPATMLQQLLIDHGKPKM